MVRQKVLITQVEERGVMVESRRLDGWLIAHIWSRREATAGSAKQGAGAPIDARITTVEAQGRDLDAFHARVVASVMKGAYVQPLGGA